MDAADLRVFDAVARTGSMNRAAGVLNTVQSNVTARIKALEDRLGQILFTRTSRGATLTPAGKRLLPYARRITALLDDAGRAVADDGTPAGPLAIGALETTAALRLSPVLTAFVAAHPAVDLSLKTGTTRELADAVLARRIDGAFVCGPIDHVDLIAEPLFREELVLVAPPAAASLDAALGAPGLRIIVLKAGCSYRMRLEAWLSLRGVVGLRLLEFGTLEAIVSSVAAGLGITLLPRALVRSVWADDPVTMHGLPDGDGAVETVFIRHRDAFVPSALPAFLTFARPRPAADAALSRPKIAGI